MLKARNRLAEQAGSACFYFSGSSNCSYWLHTGIHNSVYLTQSTGDEIPGIDAILSLYSLLGARGGLLKKKEHNIHLVKGAKMPLFVLQSPPVDEWAEWDNNPG